ncbi:hypothetical protein CL656_02275 [bacterium]|nr:hypothetical protein [bacterium]|tara:strand:- start:1959 stop:2564 length:606 start_codon:yes stop_codon:yes gene_type:complete
MKIFKNIYNFFYEIKEYQVRNTIIFLITLCLSLFLALSSNYKQQQTIDALESKILNQQNEINERLSEYNSLTESSFPDLKDTFDQAFSALEDRLVSSQITFAKNLIDSSVFLESCSLTLNKLNKTMFVYKVYLGDSFVGDVIPLNYLGLDLEKELYNCGFKEFESVFVNQKYSLMVNKCFKDLNSQEKVCEKFKDLIYLPI